MTDEIAREEQNQPQIIATPDGGEHSSGSISRAFRPFGIAVWFIWRAFTKFAATIWRLAGALDSALWNGLKHTFFTLIAWSRAIFFAVFEGAIDLAEWLPTRAGKAYTALSALVLIIAGLWIIEELTISDAKRHAGVVLTRPPQDIEDPILARLEGRYVHLSDVEIAAKAAGHLRNGETLTTKTAFDRGLVSQYVEQRMLANAAVKEGLGQEQDVAVKLSVARDRILAASLLEHKVETAVTSEQVRAIYNNQKDVIELGDEVRARHIVVVAEEEARNILVELAEGADFGSLAQKRSIDQATAPLGGEIGYFTQDMMTPILANAAFDTKSGQIAPIFFSEFGWHILVVMDRRPTSMVSFESVEERIRRFLRLQAIQETIENLRKELDVTYFPPDAGNTGNLESDAVGAEGNQ